MKKILLCLYLSLSIIFPYAQSTSPDSLKLLLRNAANDSIKVDLIEKLANLYRASNWDSVVVYSQKMLKLGIKQNNNQLIDESKASLGEAYYNTGNFSKALDLALQHLKYVESVNQSALLANALNNVGNVYKGQQNYNKAKYYYQRCEKLASSINDTTDFLYAYGNLAYVYQQLNQFDSSIYYAKKFIAAPRVTGYNVANVYAVLGDVYFKINNKKLAEYYYTLAIQSARASSSSRDLSKVSLILGQYFKKINKFDSSIFYAKDALIYGKRASYNKSVYESSDLLFELYEDLKVPDSAFKYLKIASTSRDELYNVVKFQEIENITASEEERQKEIAEAKAVYQSNLKFLLLGSLLLIILIGMFFLWRNNKIKQRAYATLEVQKKETESQKEVAEEALLNLKSTQTQLIQSEKMASLGELTAGIAHEIQNPLNFVNNFSEVSTELADEMEEALLKDDKEEAIAIAADIKDNLQKINHHGKRADAIVKGMLQHSRASTGKKESTDINALADEYVRLAYHGLRAKDKYFNAAFKTDFDESIGEIEVVSQDIGRVLLNLYNNAFYGVNERFKVEGGGYKPTVWVTTKRVNGKIEILVKDNGLGIPQKVVDKIFQPFFTTKPTGQGTGLGLSLSYDIIKAHGGELKVETKEGEGAEFIIQIPI